MDLLFPIQLVLDVNSAGEAIVHSVRDVMTSNAHRLYSVFDIIDYEIVFNVLFCSVFVKILEEFSRKPTIGFIRVMERTQSSMPNFNK